MCAFASTCSSCSDLPGFRRSSLLVLSSVSCWASRSAPRFLVLAETFGRRRSQRRNCCGGVVRCVWDACLGRWMFLRGGLSDQMAGRVRKPFFSFVGGIHSSRTLAEFQTSYTRLDGHIRIWRWDSVLWWVARLYQLPVIFAWFLSSVPFCCLLLSAVESLCLPERQTFACRWPHCRLSPLVCSIYLWFCWAHGKSHEVCSA